MSKLKNLLTGLKKTQEFLELLHENGIDIDRMIGISNAQGPQARLIKDVLSHATESPQLSSKPDKPKRSLPKKKKQLSS